MNARARARVEVGPAPRRDSRTRPSVPVRRAAIPAAAWVLTAATVTVLDPSDAGTTWWSDAGGGLLGALAFPLGLWVLVSAGLCLIAALTDSRTTQVRLALAVVASSVIVTIPWTLILSEAFPGSTAPRFGLPIAAGAAVLLAASAVAGGMRARSPEAG